MFSAVAELLPDFAGFDLNGKAVTFIPTAALHESIDFYVHSAKKALKKMGLIIDLLDVSTASPEEIKIKLRGNDLIYVSGGNTFFLLQELRRSGADRVIADEVNAGKLYVGESAGSMILAPDIGYVREMDDCQEAPELRDFRALDMIGFYPVPHHGNFPYKKSVEKIIARYGAALPLMPISNSQAILADTDGTRIVQSEA